MNPSDANDRQMLKLQARRRVIQSRLLMVFAVGCSAMLLCCCVPMVLFQLTFGPQIFQKPAEVETVAKKIAPIVLPPNFTGTQAREADNSLLMVRLAQFDQNDGRGRLVMGQFRMNGPALGTEFDEKMLERLADDLYPGMRSLEVKDSHKKIVKIHGQDVTFAIEEGEDQASTTRFKQVTGAAVGPQGAFQLLLQVEAGFLSEDEVDALLDSLADPAK